MVAFLRWAQSIIVGMLNGVAMFALFIVLFIMVIIPVLAGIGMAVGDGLPSKMVLSLDLRNPIKDSSSPNIFGLQRTPTVMDIVLALDHAGRDVRVKGMYMRLGSGGLSIAQAEEIGAAVARFRKTGKFVIAHSQGFLSEGLGDYLTAASASEIWMQPKSPFTAAGEAWGGMFLKGFFDKIQAIPQIAKRAEFKSAADTFMEKDMTPADREQTTAMVQSWYDTATSAVAADRNLNARAVAASFESSPQFADDALRSHMIDKLGYDDDAADAARDRGGDAKLITLMEYEHDTDVVGHIGSGREIALITGAGEIVEGTVRHSGLFDDSNVIAGDDFADAIRKATRDSSIKAILVRVDSPGGSVSASDQILDALK
ncbi:MAG: S49 family peptidase, partial [Rhizomicrobium sp.]